MRRIAIINQKGGVGKTTTAVNFGAALARLGRRVVVIDMDPQANASMNLGAELAPGDPSTYSVLTQGGRIADTLRGTSTPGLSILPSHLDLSGAELELASAIGRETILKDALDEWEREEIARTGKSPADVILLDNPPSLGLLSVNGLAASKEVLIAVQTEFFALQGLSKLVEIVQLLRRRLNPELEITGVLACLYDSRLRLAREVLGELRTHFPTILYKRCIAQNVKLAETPSFARTIFEYAPESKGADDYLAVAREFLEREGVEEHASGRSIEPPVRATAEPAPEANDKPPTPDAPPGASPDADHLEAEPATAELAEPGPPEPVAREMLGGETASAEKPEETLPGEVQEPELALVELTPMAAEAHGDPPADPGLNVVENAAPAEAPPGTPESSGGEALAKEGGPELAAAEPEVAVALLEQPEVVEEELTPITQEQEPGAETAPLPAESEPVESEPVEVAPLAPVRTALSLPPPLSGRGEERTHSPSQAPGRRGFRSDPTA